ncbi:MAG: UvrD-helicase domain-containing protein [Myxococcota bacterium]
MAAPRSSLDFSTLNPPQREAVEHEGAPLLVLAGAGSGKTRVITYRIARLLLEGVPGERILGVTFTNKAAREMRERMAGLVGRRGRTVHLSTFHSLGLTIVKEDFEAVGLRKGFAIYDTSDQMSLLRELMRRVKVADRRLDVYKVLETILATKRARRSEVEIDWGDDYELAAYELYPRYLEQMRAYNAVDFDDLILHAADILSEPSLALKWGNRYEHLLVDEYQDTSPDQLDLLRVLAGDGRNLCVVGDDDQSIYAWRGAAVGNILSFSRHFDGAREVVLDQNYRSTGNILRAANAVISNNVQRKEKRLWSASGDGDPIDVVACASADDEAEFVAHTIQRLVYEGRKYEDFAVLYRSNTQNRILEETMALEKIPYRIIGGQSLFDKKEVRDAIAFLSVVQNPYDEVSLRRIINVPPRGIGPTTVQRLTAYAEANRMSMWSAIGRVEAVPELDGRARSAVSSFSELMERHAPALRNAPAGHLGDAVERFLEELELRDHVLSGDDAPKVAAKRLENLDQVLHAVRRYDEGGGGGLDDFLRTTALARDKEESEEDAARGKVTLMTLHSAKGLEFPYVFLVGMEEDILPHKRTIEEGEDLSEERRLCYVGITRARRKLWLTHTVTRVRYGKPEPRTPSRFLDEIPAGEWLNRMSRAEHDDDETGAEDAAGEFFRRMREELGFDEDNA